MASGAMQENGWMDDSSGAAISFRKGHSSGSQSATFSFNSTSSRSPGYTKCAVTLDFLVRRFGVDCGDGLTWEAGWQPGGEYTKTLVVRDVTKHHVRLKYKLPESKFFSMAFPETIQLTAGLSTVLQARADANFPLGALARLDDDLQDGVRS